MNIGLWVLAGILAIALLGAGLLKLTQSRDALVNKGQAWAGDMTPAAVRAIGAAEVLGAAGLILPAVTGVLPILVPVAAVCVAVLMAGAAVVHLRRGDGIPAAVPALALLIVAVIVAVGRFAPVSF